MRTRFISGLVTCGRSIWRAICNATESLLFDCFATFRPSAAWISGLLALVTACSTEPVGVSPSLNDPIASVGQAVDMPVVDRFQLSLGVQGIIAAGAGIQVTAVGRANLPTEAVQVRVLVPELELAQSSDWGDGFSFRVNQPIPAALSTEPRRLERGDSVSGTVSVTPLVPGYYRVVATIQSLQSQAISHEGHWVRNVQVAEIWLLVTATGGIVTQDFEAQRIPANFVKEPGPFRHGSSSLQVPKPDRFFEGTTHGPNVGGTALFGSDFSSSSLTPGAITFRAIYFNADASAYEPVANADTKVQVCTVPPFQFACNPEDWTQALWTYTSDSGYVVFDCQGDQYSVDIETHAGGVNYSVAGGSTSRSGTVADECGSTFNLSLPSGSARVFVNIGKAKSAATALFGVSRPYIGVNIGSDGSYYTPSSDVITIDTHDIWGAYGIFTAAHEYGHAFHQKALGGNEGSGHCQVHFLDTESNLQCVFSEGFADFFGASVRPDLGTFQYRDYMENDAGFPGYQSRLNNPPVYTPGPTSFEGSLIESAYAAFLYDLVDIRTESQDSIAAPGSYVRELIRTCQVDPGGWPWRRANGPDEITYCAENAINPAGYFTTRGSYPTSYSESAAEAGGWSGLRVHANWTWNMYEKR